MIRALALLLAPLPPAPATPIPPPCTATLGAAHAPARQAARPRDPWVVRSVLDERPRMVTIALDEDLWVAYDATHCGLYRAWRGGVDFDGAVYTTVHGPQPTSLGLPYCGGPVGETLWHLVAEQGELEVDADFRGYRFEGRRVVLLYDLPLKGSDPIRVEESPEFVRDGEGRPGLARRFETAGVPEGVKVELEVVAASLPTRDAIWTDGTFRETGVSRETHAWGTSYGREGRLALRSNALTGLRITFASERGEESLRAIEAQAAAEAAETEAQATASAPAPLAGDGVRLEIAATLVAPQIDGQVDPVWSHAPAEPIARRVGGDARDLDDLSAQVQLLYDVENLYVLFRVADESIVNDSALPFHDDAVEVYVDGGHERAGFYDGNDAQYVFGLEDDAFWVTDEAVARHPGVAFASAREERGYRVEVRLPWANLGTEAQPGARIGLELHVDDDDDGQEGDAALAWHATGTSWSDPSLFATVELGGARAETSLEAGPREPGIAQRVYALGHDLDALPRLVPGQTPNVSRVLPVVDWTSPADFGGLQDHYLVEATGYLAVETPGAHAFRLISDDGSRLWIDNALVVDHDGLHSAEARDGSIVLEAGEHALRIAYFEATVDERLTLLWRPPGAEDFALVPAEVLSTQAGEVRVTSPGNKRVVEADEVVAPGDRYPLAGVHPGYVLDTVRPPGFEPHVGGLDFLPDGRLVVCTWDPEGAVYALEGVQAVDLDPSSISVTRIAAGLAEPLGLAVVGDEIFVLQKQELTQLVDLDGDGITDEYRAVADGWGVTANFHEFAFGLAYREGHFYAALATAIDPGGRSTQPQDPDRGKVVRIARDGGYELVAHGLRTPNGIGFGVDGELFVTDNQGDWLPSSKLLHLQEGAFYGNRSVDPEGTAELVETPPVCWLPQGEIGNSPGEMLPLDDGPYAGQMVHADVTHGGLKRVFVERVGGAYQGVVFRFTQGLEAGVHRVRRGPDGALYVGGIGSTGNWGQDGKLRYGLQRLRYTGAPAFEMLAVRVRSNGMEIELTEPLTEAMGWNPVDFEVRQWRYRPTEEYGGPKLDERELEVLSASVSEDRRRVFLELDGLLPGHVVYLRLVGPWVSEAGRTPWSTEAWYTLNRIPADLPGTVLAAPEQTPPNTLSAAERAEGFELLFDGISMQGWRGFRRRDIPAGWRIDEGAMHFDPAAAEAAGPEGRGDLLYDEQLARYELRLEWRVAEGGNSGIFFHVDEAHDYPWQTGPEMQVLDDARHHDGRNPKTSAGSNYALHAPELDVARGAGRWNQVRLVVRGREIEHWLNGHRVVAYMLGDEAWRAAVAQSKFADMPDYGARAFGHIVLQDHGDPVWFRSLRIKEL